MQIKDKPREACDLLLQVQGHMLQFESSFWLIPIQKLFEKTTDVLSVDFFHIVIHNRLHTKNPFGCNSGSRAQ